MAGPDPGAAAPPPPEPPPEDPSPLAAAVPSPRRLRRLAVGSLTSTVVALLLVVGALWALLRSEAGTAWWLGRLPGIEATGVRGALLGDRLEIDRLTWDGAPGRLQVDTLVLTGMHWRWRPDRDLWLGGWKADTLRAARVVWTGKPGDGTPPELPASLVWPLQLTLPVQIDTLQIDALPPVRDLRATLAIGADAGTLHRVEGLSLGWDRLAATGSGQIAATAPFALQAALALRSLDGATTPWQAQLRAEGTMADVQLAATLRGAGPAAPDPRGAAPTALDLRARLRPLAPWPVDTVTARTTALDLAALSSLWPQTRLDGTATLTAAARDQPVAARLALTNALPGRWNEGRLPLRQADIALRARLDAPGRVEIDAFDLQLGDAAATAGRVQGRGTWHDHRLTLDTTLTRVAPQRIDGRAAAMTVGGPLALVLDGLPSPDPAAATAPPALAFQLRATLQGRLDAAPQPVRLTLDLDGSADDIRLRTLQASAGRARAEASGRLRRQPNGWALDSSGRLADFDPLPWWPGVEGSAWRRGPHRIDAEWTLALALPPDPSAVALPTLLTRGGNQARIRIDRSLLAGVPMAADIALGTAAAGAGTGAGDLQGWIELGGNRLQAAAQRDRSGNGAADLWQLDLQAPALAALAPLTALLPSLAPWAPRAGQATATATVRGRWPALRSDGSARVTALQTGPLSIGAGRLQWQGGTTLAAPLSLRLEADTARWGDRPLGALRAEVDGSAAAHRLRVDAALPLQPPPALAQTFGLKPQRGTRLALRADGGFATGPAGARWTGQVQTLGAGGWDGTAPLVVAGAAAAPAATVADWLDARALRAQVDFDRGGRLLGLRVDPGRLLLAGSVALRWEEIRWEPDAGPWQLRAELESLRVAPLLARWQPALGWDGDLRVGATIDVRAGARFDADVVVERQSGDLQVRDPAGDPLPLGLTDLRLALNAHDGTWYFTQALAGRTLGELGAAFRVRTDAARRWPQADAPLDGTLQGRVGNLGVWGAWVPPGWRLVGSVEGSGTVSGRFGAPQVRGEVLGSGLGVRNLLEGVNLSDGRIALRLDGDRATVETFSLRGGDGVLTVTGGADIGPAPNARLTLNAERFQVLGRIDRKLVVSGQAELRLRPDALALAGRVGVDEGQFDASRADTPTLDDDVVVRRGDAPATDETAAEAQRPRRSTDVALDVDLGSRLRVRGRGLDTFLAGKLKITAPAGRLAVTGTVNTVRGTFAAYGQRLEIERGLLAFSGPVDNPRLDVLALRPNLDIEVGVAVTGTAQSPRVRLHSDPELSDTDKLSWLVLGRDPVGLGRTDTALLQRAAVALLAGEGEGPTDALIRNLGLDELSLRQSDGDVRETIVSLGKQLSRRWYVGYERGVNATVGTFQLTYRVAQSFTLRAQSGLENSLDLIWVWRVR